MSIGQTYDPNCSRGPTSVKRVEIPKPDGGVRKLGIPCVVDRLIQQALLQVLQKRWDPTFSEHSYGFRPGRSAHQAVAQAQRYVAEGYNIVVDICQVVWEGRRREVPLSRSIHNLRLCKPPQVTSYAIPLGREGCQRSNGSRRGEAFWEALPGATDA